MTGEPAPVAPEMTRPFPIKRIGHGADFTVEASVAERAALARRMGVVAIHSLTCRFALSAANGDAVRAQGALRASVRQVCVISLEPFDQVIAEDFAVCFVPAGTENEDIDLEADDEIGYSNGTLDLGEAASEQLALALDPFPRKPGVSLPETATEAESGAFAALGSLRRAREN